MFKKFYEGYCKGNLNKNSYTVSIPYTTDAVYED